MHLEQQRALITGCAERAIDPDHGQLDQVGRRALQRRIDGRALGESARVGIAAVDIRYRALTSEQSASHAGLAHFRDCGFDELLHAGIALEIRLDVLLGFGARDAELRGQAESADAIHDA